jgi:ergothioneine biosynthesis protein EgtB
MYDLLAALDGDADGCLASLLEIGLNHEQQHQELILTDIKHVLWSNPLRPPYSEVTAASFTGIEPIHWNWRKGGLYEIGHNGTGFSFDNEGPRHKVYLEDFDLASRLVTNGEYLEFIRDGGYRRPELWLSLGWSTVEAEMWAAPLYWIRRDGDWSHYTLRGTEPIDLNGPVSHVSFFEADAYARWAGARLPTEFEWESVANDLEIEGSFLESEKLHPSSESSRSPFQQFFGELWQWTASAYLAYPRYRAVEGALGEYNGKFMCNQFVLRGGSIATPRNHLRRTYRNFFPPEARWQFSGIRLARNK